MSAARDRFTWPLCIALALAAHGACVLAFARARTATAPKLRELEVTLLAPPPSLEPEPPPEKTPEPVRAQAPKAARAPERSQPPSPSPARAGALLTAPAPQAPPPANAEPVRFVTDPNGRGYGSGMVARGGTAERADELVPAPQAPRAPAGPAKPGLVLAERLSRQPSLGAHDPCRGFFPEGARSDRGEVSVIATVQDRGRVVQTEIELESPAGQGFGAAARACLSRQRFEPALDEDGKPAAARTRVRITFAR